MQINKQKIKNKPTSVGLFFIYTKREYMFPFKIKYIKVCGKIINIGDNFLKKPHLSTKN